MVEPSIKGTAKGLATIALLKTNYDQKQDHIGMFIPFVLDSILVPPFLCAMGAGGGRWGTPYG